MELSRHRQVLPASEVKALRFLPTKVKPNISLHFASSEHAHDGLDDAHDTRQRRRPGRDSRHEAA